MKKNNQKSIQELKIEGIASGGYGYGYAFDKIIFVQKAIPGDRVNVTLTKNKKKFAHAKITEILEASSIRKKPKCPHFSYCGGCTWQSVDYQTQLQFKEQIVKNSFRHIGHFREELPIRPIIPAESHYYYRGKMEFSFGQSPNGQNTLGLHQPGEWNKIFNVDHCMLFSEISNEILQFIRDLSHKINLKAYNNSTNEGVLRFLMLRQAFHTDDLLLNLVSTGEEEDKIIRLLNAVKQEFQDISTLTHNITKNKAAVATGQAETIISGSGYMIEKLLNCQYKISSNTFFQSNTIQAEKMFKKSIELLELDKEDEVLELYCGTGAISLLLSQYVKKITGIEIVEESVLRAKENQQLNQMSHCEFLVGDASKEIQKFRDNNYSLVVVDPPRAGLTPQVIQTIKKINPQKVLYISCNPDTLARDLALFCGTGQYQIKQIIPVDLFPQTPHVEVISILEKGD